MPTRFGGRGGGTSRGGAGSGAFGAVLEQVGNAAKGLFVHGPGTDPSWNLKGVERQIEAAAVRARLRYTGANPDDFLELIFGDDSQQEKRFRVSRDRPNTFAPSEVNRFLFAYQEHPVPAPAAQASYTRENLTVAVHDAGAGGNSHRMRIRTGTPGVTAVGASFTASAGDPGSNTVSNSWRVDFPAADGTNHNGVRVELRHPAANVAARVSILSSLPAVGSDERNNGLYIAISSAVAADAGPFLFESLQAGTAGNGFEINFSDDDPATSAGVTATYASATRLNVAIGQSPTIQQFLDAVNAARRNGTQLVRVTWDPLESGLPAATTRLSSWALRSAVTFTLAGGGNEAIGTATYVNRVLTVAVGASGSDTTVTELIGYINGVSAFPGAASVVGGRGSWHVTPGVSTAAGGVDGVTRTPLAATQAFVGTGVYRFDITGILPGVDTVAQVQAAYHAAVTSVSNRLFRVQGTGTDIALTTGAANTLIVNNASFTGGATAVARQNPGVQLTHSSGGYRITWHGSAAAAADRTTLEELEAAWRSIRGSGPLSPEIVMGGEGSEVINVSTAPEGISGGSDYIPPEPIEFIVLGEDDPNGQSIEVHYHAGRDTLREILDAAEDFSDVTAVEIYGTDLAASPETPPFTRAMYPSVARGARVETVSFDNVRTAATRSAGNAQLVPEANIVVEYGAGPAELLSVDRGNSRFTLHPGVYLFKIDGDVNFAQIYGKIEMRLTNTADSSEFGRVLILERESGWQHLDRSVAFVAVSATTLDADLVGSSSPFAVRNFKIHAITL